jgi:serine/threonine protein kinase
MTDRIAHFQLLASIGSGTLGELYRARDLERGRTVALRLIAAAIAADEATRLDLLSHARRVAELSHPAVAVIYGADQDGLRTYVASEFVPGQRLSDMVLGSPLNPRRALDLAIQLADGLAAAHALDLAHGALSTSRIMVTPKGAAKLLDVGMVHWTAAPPDERCDDFSGLGSVLFTMIVGRPLKPGWPGEFRLPAIPVPVQQVLRKLVAPPGGGRYQSMAIVADDLRSVALTLDSASGVPPTNPIAAGEPGWSSSRGLALASVTLVLAAVVWWLLAG